MGLKLSNLSQKVLVCTIFHELVDRFQPDLHGYILAKSSNRPFNILSIFFKTKINLKFYLHSQIGSCVSQHRHQKV